MERVHAGHLPALALRQVDRFAKRAFDVVVAVLALVLLSPVLLAAAIAIKLDSPGPVLFRQERVGYLGRRFRIAKLRTMQADADPAFHIARLQRVATGEADSKANATEIDPRITRLGRFLRKTSIDELPQLWNVLWGEMSIVGPRPAIVYEVELYPELYQPRLLVPPGITGLWQITGRGRTNLQEMLVLDLEYIERHSFLYDLKIICRTIPVVLFGKGAG